VALSTIRKDTVILKTAACTLLFLSLCVPTQVAEVGDQIILTKTYEALKGCTETISAIELYAIPVAAERRFSYAVQKNRLHAFIRISAGGKSGWAEANLGYDPENKPFEKRIWRMAWYAELKGKTVADALKRVMARRPERYRELEYAEMALLDLAGKLTEKPAIELLGLKGRDPVPGLYCILSDDPEQVAREAKRSLGQNLCTHLKVKLYGKPDVDEAVVRAARAVMGKTAYIVGDVNFGYRRKQSDEPLDDMAAVMKRLRDAGLSGCEDPAALSREQWCELQELVGTLDLVPDVPLRPAWDAARNISPGMGRVFNMHPACMGSVAETAVLGRRIKSWQKRLMVGDSSLVGPACPAWEQIAIGLGADWIEAIEKPQENAVFQKCLVQTSIKRTADGRFAIDRLLPGFGTELDLNKLKQLAAEVICF